MHALSPKPRASERIRYLALIMGLVPTLTAHAQRSLVSQLPNGGLEIRSAPDPARPSAWAVDGVGPIYELDRTVFRSGEASLHIGFRDGANAEGYSGTIQRLDAKPFAGQRIEFTGYVRRSSERSKVGIWVLASGPKLKRRVYVNSYEQTITSDSTWSRHTLTLTVPRGASSIAFGAAIYEYDGEMWVDDMSVHILGRRRSFR
jgi:hypothetical protein